MHKITSYLWTLFLAIIVIGIAPTLITMIKENYTPFFDPKTKVGRIKIYDEINDIEAYQECIKQLFKNPEIKAVLLDIESPGGAAGSSQCLYHELIHYKTIYKKPVIALIQNIGTSGAYYVACAADYIICSPSAIIGSIGAYIAQIKWCNTLKLVGAQYEMEKSGAYKSCASPFVPTTDEQKTMLQEISDQTYKQFTKTVAQQRKLPLTQALQWANGRVFAGSQALELGLVDAVGSEHNAIEKIKEFALIERDIEWVIAQQPSWLAQLMCSGKNSCIHLLNTAFSTTSKIYPCVQY